MLLILFISNIACAYLDAEEARFLSYMREIGNFFIGDEYHFRFGIYLNNLRYIKESNKKNHQYKLGQNHLMHLTATEYKSLLTAHKVNEPKYASKKIHTFSSVPESIDWRSKGIVSPVKNQANCGSCWAFSAIAAQESHWAKEKNELISLSEQNLIDCSNSNYGCSGGWPYQAYDDVIESQEGKFMLSTDYPYVAYSGACRFKKESAVTSISKYYQVDLGNENDLKASVANYGVVSVCIDASDIDFQMYESGIFDIDTCSIFSLDHAVACVGYGTENGIDYWIVRNSWGTDWGEEGYIRMVRGKNMCGIASMAVVPIEF